MQKLSRHEKRVVAIAILLIIIAIVCRKIRPHCGFAMWVILGAVRISIHIGMVAAWAFSIKQRILSAEVKRSLLRSAALMIFWLAIRTFKYNLPNTFAELNRYCWYSYYIPMLFIPLLGIFAAFCINKSEDYKLPRWVKLLCIPSFFMVCTVLTNDLHQTVFVFPNGVLNSGTHYTYGFMYYVTVLVIIAETLTFIGLLWRNNRLPGKGKRMLILFVPPLIGLMYTIAYVMHVPFVMWIAGDMTATFCIIMISTYEACIHTRLIPSNTHYGELFRISTIAAQITDENYNSIISSDAGISVGTDTIRQTKKTPVMLADNIRLSGLPITGGYAVWQEDMTELVAVLDELRDANESLEDSNDFIREENELKVREAHIAEQGRLYDVIQQDTKAQIELLIKLTDEFTQTDNEEARRTILKKMIVIGAYIKRRSNLILCEDKAPLLNERDIELTFRESLDNLELYGVDCGILINLRGYLAAKHFMMMYDLFEKVAERFDMSVLTIVIGNDSRMDYITINTDSSTDLSILKSDTVTVIEDEDGEWQLTNRLPRAGELL